MKTIQNITYGKDELTVLVTETEEGKGHVEYFVNGYQVTDWTRLKSVYQKLFSAMADDVCNKAGLTKWSY